MSRHRFAFLLVVVGVCVSLITWSSTVVAQNSKRHIAVLLVGLSVESPELDQFRAGLRDAGYTEGHDVSIQSRVAEGDYEQLPRLASEIVKAHPDVIVVDGTAGTRALKRATSTIPIVMANVADPVGSGLVPNLDHPGGNVTGLSNMLAELSAKRLQLLRDAVPSASVVAVLWNRDTPYSAKVLQQLDMFAPSLSMKLKLFGVRRFEEMEQAFHAINSTHVDALYVVEDPLFTTHRSTVLRFALKSKRPAIYGGKYWVEEGGLMSYGAHYGDLFRRTAGYVDKILKGAKPGDLPIEQPTKFELVVNLKTAKTLGITIPKLIQLRADAVVR